MKSLGLSWLPHYLEAAKLSMRCCLLVSERRSRDEERRPSDRRRSDSQGEPGEISDGRHRRPRHSDEHRRRCMSSMHAACPCMAGLLHTLPRFSLHACLSHAAPCLTAASMQCICSCQHHWDRAPQECVEAQDDQA